MRSSSGCGIVSSVFAVVMNSTFDKIECHIEIVVAERLVLLRIQYFEQRRRRIAAEIASEFIYFVEQQHRILCARRAALLAATVRPSRRYRFADARAVPPRRACRPG